MLTTERTELEEAMERIWEIGRRLGLDPFPTHFDLVPATTMYEFGAYGLPGRFSHWTRGKAFHQMKTQYDYGLSKIYELVINTNPAQAFLMEANSVLENKLVVAHVLAHVDFFKHSVFFEETSRQMVERVALAAERIRDYEGQYGEARVEAILDAALSLEHHGMAIGPRRNEARAMKEKGRRIEVPTSRYDDLWYLVDHIPSAPKRSRSILEEPDADVLGFIATHSRELEDWERDVLEIVRQEAAYFRPQMRTKIVNEGWASYWHERILEELDLTPREHREFRTMHAGVVSPPMSKARVNPYFLGYHILHDIEDRWNARSRASLDVGVEPDISGREKLFDVREREDDLSLLRKYLTKDLVERLDLFVYRLEGDTWTVVEKGWEKVRDELVASMSNFGVPYIEVVDADHHRNGGLYLRHSFERDELDVGYATKTLRYVQRLWGRPVSLEAVIDGKPTILSFDGERESSNPAA